MGSRLALGLCLAALASASAAGGKWQPASAVSAPDVPSPANSVADGVVVLDVRVSPTGAGSLEGIVRDIPSLTSVAVQSIPGWTFTPASDPAGSRLRIAFVFRPLVLSATGPALSPSPVSLDGAPSILAVGPYPPYPPNSVASGTVVLQVGLDAAGRVRKVRTVRSLSGFDGLARRALGSWRFGPASLAGAPVPSNLAVVFLFHPPVLN